MRIDHLRDDWDEDETFVPIQKIPQKKQEKQLNDPVKANRAKDRQNKEHFRNIPQEEKE